MNKRIPKALIIGLGLIGGSWAGALYKRGWDVSAVDKDQESLEMAKDFNWVTETWLEVPQELDYDLIVLALPISLATECLRNMIDRIPEKTIVTDVGSLKTEICKLAEEFPHLNFIGGHPMTGSEKSGFAAAHSELFNGYPYVLAPSTHCSSDAVQKFTNLVNEVGGKVVFRDCEEHDLQIALVSHVPHVFALALATAAHEQFPDGQTLQVAGRSFRELTRLVDSSPQMWRDIFIGNADQVLATLKICEEKILEMCSYLENNDGKKIEEVFQKAQLARKACLRSEEQNEQ